MTTSHARGEAHSYPGAARGRRPRADNTALISAAIQVIIGLGMLLFVFLPVGTYNGNCCGHDYVGTDTPMSLTLGRESCSSSPSNTVMGFIYLIFPILGTVLIAVGLAGIVSFILFVKLGRAQEELER